MADSRANPDEGQPNVAKIGEPDQASAAPLLPEEEDVVESEPEDADGPALSAAENGHRSHS